MWKVDRPKSRETHSCFSEVSNKMHCKYNLLSFCWLQATTALHSGIYTSPVIISMNSKTKKSSFTDLNIDLKTAKYEWLSYIKINTFLQFVILVKFCWTWHFPGKQILKLVFPNFSKIRILFTIITSIKSRSFRICKITFHSGFYWKWHWRVRKLSGAITTKWDWQFYLNHER